MKKYCEVKYLSRLPKQMHDTVHSILAEIEKKLYEMKEIAQYARDYELLPVERERLNSQLDSLKDEVYLLENQLDTVTH